LALGSQAHYLNFYLLDGVFTSGSWNTLSGRPDMLVKRVYPRWRGEHSFDFAAIDRTSVVSGQSVCALV
ncbi:hypothetical protein RCL20_25165, partial [Salmonella enterica subsp. enterica serovar 1,4,[5],12:i:-]